ncbi:hypothetical protein TH53_10435 [Pedobacter lusitanus]|uniref:Contig41, whole genome shotgun sequence n=1 Tax=Pedobacter lusitanus TaxID=1503925 RepID=A0A0D0GJ27_9SPHI|nr:DUF2071 domain-containing protein [Pedobacter lusitanus]KIO77257.1 hypothetical protein TH53_10435 [Pedobacter lusitanus]
MSFLTAEWRKLAIANYAIDQEILRPYLPAGTELDIWNDTCYVSLIGFLFKNTKLLGFSVPFHANFEEVNLRFYVKYKDGDTIKRGVVFIKEIVPKFALSVVANTVYHEHYEAMPMTHRWSETETEREVEYSWRCKNEWQTFSVKANKALSEILPGSEAEFITGHYWGYTRCNDTQTNEYEVKHPKWAQYKVKDFKIAVDFAHTYGAEFDCLNRQQPVSVMLAEGSDISVEGKKGIQG